MNTSSITEYTEDGVDAEQCFVFNKTDPLTNVNAYSKEPRVITLIAEIVLGNIGCILVVVWLWTNSRRLKSRVNLMILYVTVADLFVAEFAILSQLLTEVLGSTWFAGDFMCRLVKFLQIVAMLSSTNMVMMLAFDRHQAIRSPLRQPVKVWILALIAWVMAAVGALPQLFLHGVGCLRVIDRENVSTKPICIGYLRRKGASPWEMQVYLLYSSIILFFFPVTVLLVAYFRIFLKICKKERDSREQSNGDTPLKPGKIRLHATTSTSLRKAKTKTLIMTIVIVVIYIICTVPYIFVEMWSVAYQGKSVPPYWPMLTAIASSMLPTNSVCNPYVFLLFNANLRCFCDVWRRCKGRRGTDGDSRVSTRSEILTNSMNPRLRSHSKDMLNGHAVRKVEFSNPRKVFLPKSRENTNDIEMKPLGCQGLDTA